jgi:hypothetical protein
MIVTTQRCRIERTIQRTYGVSATFYWLRPEGDTWFCCDASFTAEGRGPYIRVRECKMSCEEASVLSVAISMALEWTTEMMVKEPENTGCLSTSTG